MIEDITADFYAIDKQIFYSHFKKKYGSNIQVEASDKIKSSVFPPSLKKTQKNKITVVANTNDPNSSLKELRDIAEIFSKFYLEEHGVSDAERLAETIRFTITYNWKKFSLIKITPSPTLDTLVGKNQQDDILLAVVEYNGDSNVYYTPAEMSRQTISSVSAFFREVMKARKNAIAYFFIPDEDSQLYFQSVNKKIPTLTRAKLSKMKPDELKRISQQLKTASTVGISIRTNPIPTTLLDSVKKIIGGLKSG